MTPKTWIERLEKRCPARSPAGTTVEPNFSFRVAGMPRADAQRKYVQAVETAIADLRGCPRTRNGRNWFVDCILGATVTPIRDRGTLKTSGFFSDSL